MLKRFTPKSLYGRTILIVVLPIFMMQTIVTWVFFNRHWEEVTSSLAKGTASDFGFLTGEWQRRTTDEERATLIETAGRVLEIEMRFVPGGEIPSEDQRSIFNALNRTLDRELDWSLDRPYWYNTTGFDDEVETRVQLDDGYLVYRVERSRVVARNGHFFVLWLIGATVLLGYIALVFLRNQVRSITRLAEAAEAFGRGHDQVAFKPTGAREVRQAGHAFLAMRARIKRFLEQRTEMLAGVSHDLKTPLTRLRLNLALQRELEGAEEMTADIAEMERLLEDYLTFAREDAAGTPEPTDIGDLIKEIEQDTGRLGHRIATKVEDDLWALAQRGNLKRAIANLIDNALKFGTQVHLGAEKDRDWVRISVEDDGPGIPADQREDAVRAFTRLDSARSATAGSGLGLAIVLDVARAHGGSLKLDTSSLGGLKATIAVPTADGHAPYLQADTAPLDPRT
ncbi:sensor histidine kinase [Parvularcula bermudensis HTCC2503]|uniref:histidine kinase n=1 Tax=Parvularcula bermudensis (strain ATCC BAA-594 / HTCC2503 / KCTC 12087) TaxID=314260 RepID=E0TFL2_PARBH|nr:ATP-binding protein [Parvularcula bermudensis]ADM10572.1 sensor histidine kinase [Parvularcula bermudensis HTCC2503]